MSDQGVVISPKEMYELLRNVDKSLEEIKADIRSLKEKMVDVDQADERSREALDKAKEAMTKAEAAHALASKLENHQTWLWMTVVGSLVTGAITALFYFARGG